MDAEREREYVEYVTSRLPVLRRIAHRLTNDAHRGDDLVQQAITKLYVKWRQATAAGNLDAYVQKILIRVFLDERRSRWAGVLLRPILPDTPVPQDPGVEERTVLHAALAQLPPGQRAVLVLRYIADRSVDEVAEILQRSPGTVKSQTADGLAALRRLLGEQPSVTSGSGSSVTSGSGK